MRRICWLLLVCGCSSALPLETSARKGEIDVQRDEAAALWREQRLLEWDGWTKGATVDIAETYRTHDLLFSKVTADRLLSEMNSTADKTRQRALRYLRRHILWELTGFETAKAQDELETLRRTTLVMSQGSQSFNAAELQGLQAKEPDYDKRRQLQEAAAQIYDRLADAHVKLDREINAVTRTLGFQSYLELANELRLTDLAEVGRMAEAFMGKTDAIFLPASKKVVQQELGFDFSKMRAADAPRLMRSPRYDAGFGEDTLWATQGATLRPLGMNLQEQVGLTLDLDKRPGKQKRGRTFAVVVPSDVRMSFFSSPGLATHENALHESAHALFYARSRPQTFEFGVLGDPVLPYAYGFLLQHLVGNPEWLKTHATRLSGPDQAALVTYVAWKRLAFARRYAAKVMFEVAWHTGQQGDLAQLYQNLMSRAHGFRFDETDAKRWLVDHEPFFTSAQFLRAWFLAAQMERALVRQFGVRWFDKREAGEWISAWMKLGLEPTADEIAQGIGHERITGDVLVELVTPLL
jgi:hypothetical protein